MNPNFSRSATRKPITLVDVKIAMGGSAGADRNGRRGGEGGISVFKMTLKQNIEYTVKLGIDYFQGGLTYV